MLTQIDICNLVAIRTLHLTLAPGTTAITGETGTGKSILVDAIGLALGDRAMGHPVRPGTDRAEITLTFDISSLPEALLWLDEHDLDAADGLCIIRRILTPDGRSRSYVNGTPMPLAQLRKLAEKLIHIHGQHEQQSLLQARSQTTLLDSFAGSLKEAEKVSACALAARTLHTEITALRAEIEKERAHAELLQFQLNELDALNPGPDEFQTLDQQQKQLAHAETSLDQLSHAVNCLTQDGSGILAQLSQLTRVIASLHAGYPAAAEWQRNLDSVTIQLNELEHSLQQSADAVGQDPDKLAKVESRLSAFFEIARKHRIAPEHLWTVREQLAARLQTQEKSDQHLQSLISDVSSIEKQYQETARLLSAKRKAGAKKLEQEMAQMFGQLALSHAEFRISLDPTDGQMPSTGSEQPVFCIRTSADQPLQPLSGIASGGELSRISLAIHIAGAGQAGTPTLIFDEVDTGIGGGTAETIGKLLRQLGDSRQIFCVTHTPQVAAQSHHHVRVQKQIVDGAASIDIASLNPAERVSEIARMLGGLEITRKTLAHAEEMTEKAQTV